MAQPQKPRSAVADEPSGGGVPERQSALLLTMLTQRIYPASITSDAIRREVEIRLNLALQMLGQGWSDDWKERVRAAGYQPPPRYGFDIYVNDGAQANAFTGAEKSPFIEFSLSLPFVLRALFGATLAQEDLLNELPDVAILALTYRQRCACDWRGLRQIISQFSPDRFQPWLNALADTGLDAHRGRAYLATMLSLQAEAFVMYHELGHYRMGHLCLLDRRRLAGKALPPLLQHAFELEADRNAISTMFQGFFAPSTVPLASSLTVEMQAMQRMGNRSRWRIWTTMVGALFLLLHMLQPPSRLVGGRWTPLAVLVGQAGSHPPALYRLKHAVEWARHLVLDRVSDGREDYDAAVVAAFKDLSILSRRLGVQSLGRFFHRGTRSYEAGMAAARQAVGDEMLPILMALEADETQSRGV